jgi:sulfoxide reductase catalytic subunit YedY
MAHRYKSDLTWDDVTPREMYLNRRQIMAGRGRFAGGGLYRRQGAGAGRLGPDADQL